MKVKELIEKLRSYDASSDCYVDAYKDGRLFNVAVVDYWGDEYVNLVPDSCGTSDLTELIDDLSIVDQESDVCVGVNESPRPFPFEIVKRRIDVLSCGLEVCGDCWCDRCEKELCRGRFDPDENPPQVLFHFNAIVFEVCNA